VAEFLLRWFHYLGGITWIGLLYYFNFVQGPFMAEADPAAKSTATQKLLPRALAWFRGGAIVTFLTGLAILGKRFGESPLGSGAWSTPWAITILTGALFGTLMFFNVVLVIWPKQQIVIASAKAAASHAVLHGRRVALHVAGRRQSRGVLGERDRCGGADRDQCSHRHHRNDDEADRKDHRCDRDRIRRVGRRVRAGSGVPIGLTA
jgi:hypothetical protein